MDDPLSLTFGIELECIVRYNPAEYEAALNSLECGSKTKRQTKFDILVRKTMGSVLKGLGLPVCEHQEEASVEKWTITWDESISWDDEAKGNFVGVEIISPAYNLSEAALKQVEEAIKLLTDKFDIIVNQTCGLHVHVGNSRKSFPLQTLKNFCMLTTIFEPQLNSLHPLERVFNCNIAKGPTEVFEGINPWDTALLIQSFQSHKELALRYAKEIGKFRDRFCAYNLVPLVIERGHNTIEFRQHEATTDTTEICKWIELTCGLLEVAHNIAFEQLTQLIEEFAFDTRPSGISVLDLLHKSQLHELANYYGGRQCHSHSKPRHAWVDRTLEDAMDLPPEGPHVEFVGGKRIVKTLAHAGGRAMGHADAGVSRKSYASASTSDEETTKVASSEELSNDEKEKQPMPRTPAEAERQRIQNIVRLSPTSAFRLMASAEPQEGGNIERVKSNASTASVWSVD